MVHADFWKHRVVLNLRFPQWWAVVGNEDQLSCDNQFSISWNYPINNRPISFFFFFFFSKLRSQINAKSKRTKPRKMKQTFRISQRFEYTLVSKRVLAALHDESEPVVDALMSLLLRFSQKRIQNTKNSTNQRSLAMRKRLKSKETRGREKVNRTVFFPATIFAFGSWENEEVWDLSENGRFSACGRGNPSHRALPQQLGFIRHMATLIYIGKQIKVGVAARAVQLAWWVFSGRGRGQIADLDWACSEVSNRVLYFSLMPWQDWINII